MTVISVADHGATGDGETLDTDAIQSAIDACAESGGGTVRVPAGEYRTGTIELRDHVTLDLEAGATIRGSTDLDDYRTAGGPYKTLIAAIDAEDVSVTGNGTIDGSGTAFMDMDAVIDPHDDPAIDTFEQDTRQGDRFLSPDHGTEDGPVEPLERPQRLLLFYGCTNVRVDGVTIRESPHWTLHLLGCEHVDVHGVDIHNEISIPNSDGINPECSENVHISDCTVVTGDDAICPKASDEYDVSGPLENLTVTNCILVSRSSAIKFGSGTGHDMRDCTFSNIVVRSSNRGLGIQHRDAGTVEDVLFSNITLETQFHTGNWWGMAEPVYVTSVPRRDGHELGAVRNIRFSDVVATGEGGVVIYGSEEATVEDITFDGVSVTVTESDKGHAKGGNLDLRPSSAFVPLFEHDIPGVYARGVTDLTLADVAVDWESPPGYCSNAVECESFDGVTIEGFEGRGCNGAAAVALRDGRDITVRDSRASPGTGTFLAAERTDEERLFLGNDLSDAETPIDGETDFVSAGNRFSTD
jgi:polygalacturonase